MTNSFPSAGLSHGEKQISERQGIVSSITTPHTIDGLISNCYYSVSHLHENLAVVGRKK